MGWKSLGLLCVTSMGAEGAERLRFLSEDMAGEGKLCAPEMLEYVKFEEIFGS